jgi:hypothetical protein
MGKSFIKRLRVPLEGRDKFSLYSKSGTLLATGYTRVVIGKRGPYVEFREPQIQLQNFQIPQLEEYRVTNGVSYYIEYRSKDPSYVKLYFQKRTVAYADYKIGRYYISPFDLVMEYNQKVINER